MYIDYFLSGLITVLFILNVVLVNKVYKSANSVSPLRKFAESHLGILLIVMMYGLWETLDKVFNLAERFGPSMVYPQYILMSLFVLVLVFSSIRLNRIYQEAKEMGLASE